MAIKRALVSVSDKTGVVELAKFLHSIGVEIISTGGTMKAIKDAGIPVTYVSDVTGFPEMMDGRVKTLNPKIHGGILAIRSNPKHMQDMKDNGIKPIDLVVVNLYPFKETVAKPNVTEAECIENIDIGGPAMLRAAAKNFRDVIIITNPARYKTLIAMLSEHGDADLRTRKTLAKEAFAHTAEYDAAIAAYLTKRLNEEKAQNGDNTIMQILVLGGGGREHAIVWKLAQSKKVEKIYCAPGNPGIAQLAECVNLDTTDNKGLAHWAKEHHIDLTVVGPEVPLVAGVADEFRAQGLAIFGPNAKAAALEGSKAFSKELMKKYNIPTAFFKVCNDLATAKAYVEEKGAPIVVKADGLAAGKGVIVAMTKEEAITALEEIMTDHKFGAAGANVVVEEFMDGEEASLLAFTDGKTVVPMIAAQDHKRVNDGDQGLNTGGMGAYAPAPVLTEALKDKCMATIIGPVLKALETEGRPYSGCLYAGLMIKGDSIKVVEFNARFGDPETQAVLPLLDGDLAEIMLACATGTLKPEMVKWSNKAAVCVVMASGGYPGSYAKNMAITGLQEANNLPDVVVFQAGTKEANGQVVTNGGRVLGVTAVSDTIANAKEKAYAAVERIHFENAHYRTDIAWRALRRK